MELISLVFTYKSDKENVNMANYTKSIRLLSNEVTIAIRHAETKDLYLLNQYKLPSSYNNRDLIAQIAEINENLQLECKKNIFYLYNKINTQIPKDFYDKKNEDALIATLTPDSQLFSSITEWIDIYDFYNFSICEDALKKAIDEYFPKFLLKTTISNLFQLINNYNQTEKKILVFVENKHFTILAVERNNFLAANGFSFANELDFTYYIVNFIRKIFVQTEEVQIMMIGHIEEESPVFRMVKKYFKDTLIDKNTGLALVENSHYFCDLF